MTASAVDSMQGLSYTNAPTATPSRETPAIAKVVNMGRPGLSNDIIWAVHEMRKSDQNHRSSVVARVTKDRVWALRRAVVRKFATVCSSEAIHKRRPHVAPATHLDRRTGTTQSQSASTLGCVKTTRKRQFRFKELGTGTIFRSQEKSTNWLRKPNDIPWM